MSSLRITQTEFLIRAKAKHGNTYDYSNSKFVGISKPIDIVCRSHGLFTQTTSNHLAGKGCNECAKIVRGLKRKLTTKLFVAKAIKLHGTLYDYCKTNYVDSKQYVIITCVVHGDFKQRPNNHLTGRTCPACAGHFSACYSNTKGFIKRSRELNGSRYTYARTQYVNAKTKLIITCRKHGDFLQAPDPHLNKNVGCPSCNNMNNPEFYQANINKFFRTKQVKLADGREVALQGYELFAVDYLSKEIDLTRIRFGKKTYSVAYEFENKMRRYYPDMRYGKTLVEVKSLYTWRLQIDKNKEKLRAALRDGYNIRLLVFDKNGSIVKDVKRKAQ